MNYMIDKATKILLYVKIAKKMKKKSRFRKKTIIMNEGNELKKQHKNNAKT